MSIFLLSAGTLWRREIVRFLRQRSRIVGAFGPPILFWLILGSGFGESFRYPGLGEGGGYLEYFYPGILAMVILFTAIFSTIAVVEDRKERFLQAVLVAPAPRTAIGEQRQGHAARRLAHGERFSRRRIPSARRSATLRK